MRLWTELTTTDFAGLDPARTVALLPVGAVEQHGPHLPLSTDATIAEGIAHRGASASGAEVLVLPTLAIGKSCEHLSYPGTLTLGAETLTRLWTETAESVARAGLRKIVFLNAHGGQPQIMQLVARDLRVRLSMLAVAANWWDCGYPEGLFPEDELTHGIHGGRSETSIMLHLRPDLVRMAAARNFRSQTVELAGRYRFMHLIGAPGAGWMAQDLHPEGVAGNAAAATAEDGARIVAEAAAGLAQLLDETADFPLDRLRTRELPR